MTDSTANGAAGPRRIVIWIAEGTWPAAVDAARRIAPADATIALLHVTAGDIEDAAHGAYTGLLGRADRERDPGPRIGELAATSARELLDQAARRLGRACSRAELRGRPGREVVEASGTADLLIVARDGGPSHPGPRSIGPQTRYAVDHARCAVLLVWPEPGPRHGPGGTQPPPRPPRRHGRPGGHHGR